MTRDLFKKFLNDSYSSEEWELIFQWIKKESLSEQSIKWAKQEWHAISKSEDKQLTDDYVDILLYKIHHKINISNQLKTIKHPYHQLSRWLTKAAAIMLLPALGILFFALSKRVDVSDTFSNVLVDSIEIATPLGSRSHVLLSDGSEIYLNYGSKVKYPQVFSGDTREVMLSGEGYFIVAHNPDKPFIVKTNDLNIKAIGTEFNVHSYPEEKVINTSLVNGEVIIERVHNNGEIKLLGAMVPDENICFNKNSKEISSTKGNIEKYLAWRDGKLIFENESIEEITNVLSRMFNVDFEIRNEVKFYTYTVTFMDEHLFQILDLMEIATPVKYKTVPRKKQPDDSYSKQKIIIEKNNKPD